MAPFIIIIQKRHDLLLVPPEEFLGKKFFDVLPLEAANACMQAIAELIIPVFQLGAIFLELPLGKWFELSIAPMEQVIVLLILFV
jgi:hypothetical protein